MDNQHQQRVINTNNVFDKRFLDTKTLYLYCFNRLPSLSFINQLDGEKAFLEFKAALAQRIEHIHQYRWYKQKQKKYQFDRTVIILKNNCLVEFGSDYCEMLHDGHQEEFVSEMTTRGNKLRQRLKRQPLEIKLVIESSGYMELKAMEIKREKLDLNLFYGDDFKEVDALIRKRLNQKKD